MTAAPACGAPGADAFAGEAKDRFPIVKQEFDPRPFTHLREINAAEEKPCDEMADSDVDRCFPNFVYRFPVPLGTVGARPCVESLFFGILDRHL